MNKIHLLEPRLANQIAAGEVVERPASVVKELLENAIDAGATRIEIDLEAGGTRLIRIFDNGHGIAKQDLALALSRHATSKISNLQDLAEVQSLGFRGEALASISSVSHFTLRSCTSEQDTAWQVQVEGRDMEAVIQAAAHPVGTTIEVRDLFFNTPVRRKFLRREKTELGHIEELVKRMALSRYDISFVLRHNRKTVQNYPAANEVSGQEKRIANIFGPAFLQHSHRLDIESSGLQLLGYVGLGDFSRSQADQQYFYVNGRLIRDKLINHAIRQAYQDYIYPGRHPVYVLYLQLAPTSVDVNVHPTKHEVRFCESRLVHDFLLQSVLNAISSDEVSPAEQPTDIHVTAEPTPQATRHHRYQASSPSRHAVREHIQQYARMHPGDKAQSSLPAKQQPLGEAIACLNDTIIIAENNNGLVMVDLRQAEKAVAFAKFSDANQNSPLVSQPLLMPISIALEGGDCNSVLEYKDILSVYGFGFEAMGPNTVVIRKIPAFLDNLNVEVYFKQLFAGLSAERHMPAEKLIKHLADTIVTRPLAYQSQQQQNQLLRQLEKIKPSAEFKNIWKELSVEQLSKLIHSQREISHA